MKYIDFAENERLSTIVLGMMRISELGEDEVEALVEAALSIGINTFDLADIYGNGQCEVLLGKVIKRRPDLRDQMWIQSKCGIRKDGFTYFDFSKDYILDSVDGILERLQIERLDSLLLHRPDALMEPEEVAEAFNHLEQAGKVRHFGVSNQNPMMMELLKTTVKQPLKVNQLQLSAAFTPSFDAGFHVNMEGPKAAMRDGSVFEYCRLNDTVIQAWSVLQHGYSREILSARKSLRPSITSSMTWQKNTKSLRQPSPLLGSFAIQVRCRLSSERPSLSMSLKQGKQQKLS